MLPAMSRTQSDLQKEIERLSQNIEEGERAIVRKLDELGRMSGPATEAEKSLLQMIDALGIERQCLQESMRAMVMDHNSST